MNEPQGVWNIAQQRADQAEAALTTLRTQLQALAQEMRHRAMEADWVIDHELKRWADRLTRLSEAP